VTSVRDPLTATDPAPSPVNTLRYLAWLYSAPQSQRVLQILLEIESEIRGILRPGSEHQVAHLRLEWWRAESERLLAGTPAHPLSRQLLAESAAGVKLERSNESLRPPDLSGLIDTATWDLAAVTFANRDEVTGYCRRWASAIVAPLLSREDSTPAALTVGTTLREIELLCNLDVDASAGRLRLPLDELAAQAIEPEALAKSPWPAKLVALLVARHRELRALLAASVGQLPLGEQPGLRGLLVWAALAHRRSRRAAHLLPLPMSIGRGALLTETWFAWRVARRAARGELRLEDESH